MGDSAHSSGTSHEVSGTLHGSSGTSHDVSGTLRGAAGTSRDVSGAWADASGTPLVQAANEALVGLEQRLTAGIAAPELPTVFILGPPRSGTTLLSQLLAHWGGFAYVSNFLARYWLAPYVGSMIEQHMGVRSNRAAPTYRSRFGGTSGLTEPHEFTYFWNRWFLQGQETQKLNAEELARIDKADLRHAVGAVEAAWSAPVVFKNAYWCNFQIEFLADLFPFSVFVRCRRQAAYTAQSVVLARERIVGSRERWWSMKPACYPELRDRPWWDQVLGQVRATEAEITAGLSRVPDGRVLEAEYDHICRDPNGLVRRIVEAVNRLGGEVPVDGAAPAGFESRDRVRLPPEDFARIEQSRVAPSANTSSAGSQRRRASLSQHDYAVLDVGSDHDRWSEVMAESDLGDVYFSPGFHELFGRLHNARPKLFVYDHERGRTLFPVLLRDIPGSDRRDVSTVYGYGGLLMPDAVRGDSGYRDSLLAALADWYRQERVVTEFVRYHPALATHAYSPMPTSFVRHTVLLDTTRPLDAIWAGYRSNTRRKIRQARRAELRFDISSRPDRLAEFATLYGETMARRNAAPFYRFSEAFLRRHFECLPGNTYLAVAELEGVVVAAALFLGWGSRLHYHLGASKSSALELRPNDFLMNGVIEWAHGAGFSSLHLGGGYSGDDALFSFKRGFSPEGCRQFHVSRRVVDTDPYKELVQAWRRKLPADAAYDRNFFPRYRAPVLES